MIGRRPGSDCLCSPAVKVRIDRELCAGHGRCYGLAPGVYDCDDLGHGMVIAEEVPESLRAQAELGAQNCPERAIVITED